GLGYGDGDGAASPSRITHYALRRTRYASRNTEASARTVSVALSAEDTRALVQEVPVLYHAEIDHVLLAALAQALAHWTGAHSLFVDLEAHGRTHDLEGVDVSRTAGWFTAIYPVRLDLNAGGGPGDALQAVRTQVSATSQRGISYGLLRYLCQAPEVRQQLAGLPQPEVALNYLGQLDRGLGGPLPFGIAPESRGPERAPEGRRSHLLEINGGIAGGRLQLEWTYSERLHRRETIQALADAFVEALLLLVKHAGSAEAGRLAPAGLAEFGWSQGDIDGLAAEIEGGLADDSAATTPDLASDHTANLEQGQP
ncbi:MAG TPA: condensation domain-containing protein, partial [Anaerolineae bacterium]|nr:condensation domain-containing protein [Anaerolineae bacterium]HOR01001.1 condensation domain-containing protein [Anaerolineae bacterium]HPL30369.1 condensation domain-containing protein [Anaerolineae bacterium]